MRVWVHEMLRERVCSCVSITCEKVTELGVFFARARSAKINLVVVVDDCCSKLSNPRET